MKEAVILSAVCTAVGRFGGTLRGVTDRELGLATMCLGGGQGMALVVRKED